MSFILPTISALGTSWWIEIFDDMDASRRDAALGDITAFLQTFENRYSRFKPDSLVSILNQTGGLDHPDTALVELLHYGVDLFDRTNGTFNLLIGEALIGRGYDATYSLIPTTDTVIIPRPNEALSITPARITLNRGKIDIGGYGKGYVIDLLTEYLKTTYSFNYFLINGGGDMYATSDHDTPLTIYLEHPVQSDTYLATTTLYNQGFAASSPHKRAWQYAGTTYHHIISPNETTADATFIKATTARDADAFATTALIMTPGEFSALAEREALGIASYQLSSSLLTRNARFDLTTPQ